SMNAGLAYKRARMFWSILYGHLVSKRQPINVYLAVTNRCNLKCYYCYGEYADRKDWREFTTEELLTLIDELWRNGTRLLQLQGGEPLLRDDIGTLVDRVRARGMICDMITNGVLVERKFDVVKKLDSICVSLDGREGINDRNRGKGTFQRTMAAIERCAGEGIPTRINAVLTAQTEPADLRFLAETARRLKLLLNFSLSFQYEALREGGPRHHLDVSDEQVRGFLGQIKRLQAERYPIQFTALAHDLALAWPFSYQKRMAVSSELPISRCFPKCYHADYIVFIDGDGSVYPCCNFWGKPRWNIREHGLTACLNNVSREGCEACYILSYLDRNLVFGLSPKTLLHYAVRAVRELI
ncbi:MAG: radical SAM protein, partial [Candidatus Aureabacteria bacterium]|nr:radical SAM protein [Candidatus Auribacterota bacterium]